MIQSVVDDHHLYLDTVAYFDPTIGAVCIIGALHIAVAGLRNAARRSMFRFEDLRTVLAISMSDLCDLEAGFEGWEAKIPSAWYKLGVELRNTYV